MNSYWNESKDTREYPKLNQNISADVCIIGGRAYRNSNSILFDK